MTLGKGNGPECAHGYFSRQLLVKITNDELTALMGGQSEDIRVEGNPAVILIAGLQGSGKTLFRESLLIISKNKVGP
jgi:signal recognition particle subunit SRP54